MKPVHDNLEMPHRQAWDLIPWVVARNASPAEQALVARHAALCPDCREELAFHTDLRTGLAAGTPAPHDLEPAWQRLQARFDEAQPAGSAPVAGPADPRPQAPLNARLVRMLVAAVVVQAVGLTALGGALWQRTGNADYQTLSLAPAAPSTATIRLVPSADLSLGRLPGLLARAGVRLVDINADGSLLGLALDPAGGRTLDQALQQLRAEPGVRLAEPLPEVTAARP
jgi:hypothetical protein